MKKPMLLVKWFFYLMIVTAIGYGLYLALLPQPVDVDLAPLETGSMLVTVNEDGKTRIREKYVVSAPLAGRLLRVDMNPGDEVLINDKPLAVIKPRDPVLLDAREVRQAEMRVKTQEAILEQAGPSVESAKAALEFAEIDAKRLTRLNETGSGAQVEYDQGILNLRMKQEAYRAALYAKTIAEFELEQAKAALMYTRKDDDQPNFKLVAPIEGRVLRVFQESATIVNPGTPLIEIGDPHDLEVVVDVLSSDAIQIQPGADVILERWGGEKSLRGQVKLIEPSAFTKISSLGVEEQRVNVIIDLLDPLTARTALGDGFRVEAKIVTWQGKDVLKVPSGAMFRKDGKWAVYTVEENTAILRFVEIGRQNELEAEVLSGLQASDLVIMHPGDKITHGIAIKPRKN